MRTKSCICVGEKERYARELAAHTGREVYVYESALVPSVYGFADVYPNETLTQVERRHEITESAWGTLLKSVRPEQE